MSKIKTVSSIAQNKSNALETKLMAVFEGNYDPRLNTQEAAALIEEAKRIEFINATKQFRGVMEKANRIAGILILPVVLALIYFFIFSELHVAVKLLATIGCGFLYLLLSTQIYQVLSKSVKIKFFVPQKYVEFLRNLAFKKAG